MGYFCKGPSTHVEELTDEYSTDFLKKYKNCESRSTRLKIKQKIKIRNFFKL